MISHYSLLGTLSNRPVVKGARKPESLDCTSTNYFNKFADLKRKDLKPLIKKEELLESNIIQNGEEKGPILAKKKK